MEQFHFLATLVIVITLSTSSLLTIVFTMYVCMFVVGKVVTTVPLVIFLPYFYIDCYSILVYSSWKCLNDYSTLIELQHVTLFKYMAIFYITLLNLFIFKFCCNCNAFFYCSKINRLNYTINIDYHQSFSLQL